MRCPSTFGAVLFLVIGLACNWNDAWAGPNVGGTLVVNVQDVVYSSGTSYCNVTLPENCQGVVARVDEVGDTFVCSVLAVFGAASEPRLAGLQFGIDYPEGVFVDGYGSCAEFELPSDDWPAAGSGTAVVWTDGPQTDRVTQVYWFALSTDSTEGKDLYFQLGNHPVHRGAFVDDAIPGNVDPILNFGRLGFFADGEAPCLAEPRTVVLRADGSGDYPTLEEATQALAPGSIIELEDGAYRGPGNRDFSLSTGYTIRSISGDPTQCYFDIEATAEENRRAFVFQQASGPPLIIEGVGFLNGDAQNTRQYQGNGGAIALVGDFDVVFRNCLFQSCVAGRGGAVYATGSSSAVARLRLESCVFEDNQATEHGGGALYLIRSVNFGMRDCTLAGNRAEGVGGALFYASEGNPSFHKCQFLGNHSLSGGAVFLTADEGLFDGCTFAGNVATQGGAVYAVGASFVLQNSTLVDNEAEQGSSLFSSSHPAAVTIRSSILAGGTIGSAVDCGGATWTVQRTDIWGSSAGDWPSCLSDAAGRFGNLSADPLFCDPESGSFRLRPDSPLVHEVGLVPGVIGAWPVGCSAVGTTVLTSGPLGPSDNLRLTVSSLPNPFQDGTEIFLRTGANTGYLRVEIFDIAGRQKAVLLNRPVASDQVEYRLFWDGTDETGRPSPAGVYFARITTATEVRTLRLTRVQ